MFEKELEELKAAYEANFHPENAQAMKDYMRGQYEFFGLKRPLRSELSKSFLQSVRNPDKSAPKDIIVALWDLPQREYQLTAVDLVRKYDRYAPADYLDLYEYLITTKSWWDTVDLIASNSVGKSLKKFPELKKSYLKKWMDSENIWLQRTCLLFQLKYGNETDFDLLCAFIRRLSHSDEFFIRKAIGWALRQYSRFDADAVRDFLSQEKLAPLSVREASKYL